MAGQRINLVPKRMFDFSSLAMSTQISITLAEQIDVLQYCDAIVVTRVHAASLAGGDLTVQLQPDGHVDGDSSLYAIQGLSYFGYPITLNSSVNAGAAMVAGNVDPLHGQFAKLIMTASKYTAANLSATLSIDLLLRSPEDINDVVALAVAKSGGCCCEDA